MTETFRHREIVAELITDEDGQDIFLSQQDDSGCNEPSVVILAPWQLRALCEQFALIPSSDPQAAKTIATLQRRLRVLADRTEYIAHYLTNRSDHKHADLNFEVTYANATADIAAEFVAEINGVAAESPKQAPERVKPSTATAPRQLAIDV